MIDYLEELVEKGEYKEALSLAEKLLLNKDNSQRDLMVINVTMAMCRFQLGEYLGATVAGEVGAKIGLDLEEWDYYGLACLTLGASHYLLRQNNMAAHWWYEYVAQLPRYGKARKYEATVWYDLGLIHVQEHDTASAIKAFTSGLEAANRLQNHRHAHGIRQALIGAYLQANSLSSIPRLLARCRKYIRDNPDAHQIRSSYLWHLKLRAEFAMATGRLSKARFIALRGLEESNDSAEQQFHFHMTLAKIAIRQDVMYEALGHSISARLFAISLHRHDLESEAAEFSYDITTKHPDAMKELDRYLVSVDADCDRSTEVLPRIDISG